jgi:hypothetical protein
VGGEAVGPATARDEHPGPCPACGEPLFGWTVVGSAGAPRTRKYVLDRCENCGLGLARDREGARIVEASEGDVISVPNRRSWQAGIGGGHWGALELPVRTVYATPQSLELLLGRLGFTASRIRQPALGRNQGWMWLTLMNAFTFHDGFARDLIRGDLTPRTARSIPAFAADLVVSMLAALPLALISVPLELAAVAFRRGGLLEVAAAPPDDQAAVLDRARKAGSGQDSPGQSRGH